jgi:hypothetical protein
MSTSAKGMDAGNHEGGARSPLESGCFPGLASKGDKSKARLQVELLRGSVPTRGSVVRGGVAPLTSLWNNRGTLIVVPLTASFVVAAAFFIASDFAERLATRGQAATVERITLRNEEHAFELQYPGSYHMTTRHALDASYEETFYFQDQSSMLMLQIIDLRKYLPKTNTPNENLYLKSLRQLAGFKSIRVDDKNGYQYRTCGRASCALNVMFIHRGRQYTFVADNESDVYPASAAFATLPVDQQEIIRSFRFFNEAGRSQNRSK